MGTGNNLMDLVFMDFEDTAILRLKLWGGFIIFAYVRKEENCARNSTRINKRELNELRKFYIKEKSFNVIDMYEYNSWRIYKTDTFFYRICANVFLRNASQRRDTLGKYQTWKSAWFCSMWYWSRRVSLKSFCRIFQPPSKSLMLVGITLVRSERAYRESSTLTQSRER